eukprot:6427320-Amphidinium_carterae.2
MCAEDALVCDDLRRPSHVPPMWVRELAEFLRFSVLFRYNFSRHGHINCLEARAQKSCLKHLAKLHPSARVILLQDSRVTIGSTAKGRSSSAALNHIARTQLPYILGGGLQISALHVPSALHRADDPSRNVPVRPPSRPVPAWYSHLVLGYCERFDLVLRADSMLWPWSGWRRLLLQLHLVRNALYGLRGVRIGEASHPGPPPVAHRAGPLRATDLLEPRTLQRRSVAVAGFASWLLNSIGVTLDCLALSGPLLNCALEGYAQHLCKPYYHIEDAVNGVVDLHPHLRSSVVGVWRLLRRWKQLEPGRSRTVAPVPLVRAMSAVSLLWGWVAFAAAIFTMFSGLLHPSELLLACRSDLVLPCDL